MQHAQHLEKHQEAVRVGNLIVIAQPDKDLFYQLRQRLLARGYQVSETTHFVVCHKRPSDEFVILHRFEQTTIDADLICVIEQELSRFSFCGSERGFGGTLFAVLASTFPSPREQGAIWRRFCMNSLEKLRDQLAKPPAPMPSVSYIAPFAAIYRRVLELSVGRSFIDVGCSFGFLPILMEEAKPDARIVGCDISLDALGFSNDLATVYRSQHVTFSHQNVLDESLATLGTFDTVTAIHLLEHLPEERLPLAFKRLLQVTQKRLIIAVPYEEEATRVYGHAQLFTPNKLERWGQWCIDALGGAAHFWCEEVAGGLLMVDRSVS